jgi:hypothetical protein
MTVAVLVACAVVLALVVACLPAPARTRHDGLDYEAMAEVESHDVEDMLNAIAERRRRTGRRDLGEELSDELLRGGWH